jgi:zona occludens toxin (predicted ATPase)
LSLFSSTTRGSRQLTTRVGKKIFTSHGDKILIVSLPFLFSFSFLIYNSLLAVAMNAHSI